MNDFNDALAKWVRDASYSMPGSAVADMLESALSNIRPSSSRPVALRSGRHPVGVTAPTPAKPIKRRGRPKAQPDAPLQPAQPVGEGSDGVDF